MEYESHAPPSNIDRSAVDIHRPTDEQIQEILNQAAQHERLFLTPETDTTTILTERYRQALGWRGLH